MLIRIVAEEGVITVCKKKTVIVKQTDRQCNDKGIKGTISLQELKRSYVVGIIHSVVVNAQDWPAGDPI